MHDHKLNLEKNTSKLIEQGILSRESIDFYMEIFNFQSTCYSRWSSLSSLPRIKSREEGEVFLEAIEAGDTERELLIESCASLCSVIEKHNPGMNLSSLAENMKSTVSAIDSIINALLEKDPVKIESLAAESRIGVEEFLFIIINWLRPFFIALREKNFAVDNESYGSGHCPFCGYYPDMGIYAGEKENRHYLHCQLCEKVWPYKRLACAVCGTEDKSRLEYFTDEADERYRVDACHDCKGFIKSVRLNKFEELESCDPVVENLITLSLDAEMLNKGFSKI